MKRARRIVRVAGLRLRRTLGRHYASLGSGLVLSVAAFLALTSTSFDRAPAPGAALPAQVTEEAQVPVPPTPSPQPSRQIGADRPLVVIYLVMDEEEGRRLVLANHAVMWDAAQSGGMEPRNARVGYRLAGTPEDEAVAVSFLNAYTEIAALHGVDVKVVDIRPDRRPAATAAPP